MAAQVGWIPPVSLISTPPASFSSRLSRPSDSHISFHSRGGRSARGLPDPKARDRKDCGIGNYGQPTTSNNYRTMDYQPATTNHHQARPISTKATPTHSHPAKLWTANHYQPLPTTTNLYQPSSGLLPKLSPVQRTRIRQRQARQRRDVAAGAASSTAPVQKEPPRVVIIPGYLTNASEYIPMAQYLRKKGYLATIVPIRWYQWIPTMGGRSMRPILDRIDATVAHALMQPSLSVVDGAGNEKAGAEAEGDDAVIPQDVLPPYSFGDWLKEMANASRGASPAPLLSADLQTLADAAQERAQAAEEEERALEAEGGGRGGGGGGGVAAGRRIAIVGHSAGGWIARILLGSKAYDQRAYAASRHVYSLVTLGTPHTCTDKLTSRNIDYVNNTYPGAFEAAAGVRYACVGGNYRKGATSFGGLVQDFTYQSYVLCCGRGDVDGDGITPVECAVALEGAEKLVLEGVGHAVAAEKEGAKWYGTPDVIDKWLPFLEESASA